MTAMTSHTTQFENFDIVYQLKQQIRIKAPSLHQNPERAHILKALLCKRAAVESAQVFPDMASVAIYFDPVQLPIEKLFILLDMLLTNIGGKVSGTLPNMKPRVVDTAIPEWQIDLTIQGMSCHSCAISLQMSLQREPRICEAKVDFPTKKAQVKGNLSPQDTVEIVRTQGFEAIIIET